MKINWGTGIVIAFVIFISFIMYFVVQMVFDSKYEEELVAENYYQHEYAFQEEIDALQNSRELEEKVSISLEDKLLEIKFPSDFESDNIKGSIHFYRPSDKHLDFKIPVHLESNTYQLPTKDMLEGYWDISVDWTYDGTRYMNKRTVYN